MGGPVVHGPCDQNNSEEREGVKSNTLHHSAAGAWDVVAAGRSAHSFNPAGKRVYFVAFEATDVVLLYSSINSPLYAVRLASACLKVVDETHGVLPTVKTKRVCVLHTKVPYG